MVDMICLLAKEEKFVTLLDSKEQYTSSHCNARRLVVHRRAQPLATMSTLQARSFNAMCSVDLLPSLSCFEVLRVLALEGNGTLNKCSYNLEHVGKLVHLRHLKLGSIGISELPKEIGHLKFLLVLDLGRNSIRELPESIGRLSELKCLNIWETDIEVPYWIGNLTSLEELCLGGVHGHSNFVTELGKLTELRKLRIFKSVYVHGDRRMNSWAESVAKLSKIQVIDIGLVVGCRDSSHSHEENPWERIVLSPQIRVLHMSFLEPGMMARINPSLLPNLSHLKLHVCSPDMEVFGSFRELVALKLETVSTLHHDTIGGGAGAFPKLRFFRTEATLDSFQEGDMPVLESLQFEVVAQSSDDGISFDFDFASLGNLPLLKRVVITLYAPRADDGKAKETAKRAMDMLPNRVEHSIIPRATENWRRRLKHRLS